MLIEPPGPGDAEYTFDTITPAQVAIAMNEYRRAREAMLKEAKEKAEREKMRDVVLTLLGLIAGIAFLIWLPLGPFADAMLLQISGRLPSVAHSTRE